MSNQKSAINGAKWTTIASVVNTALSFIQLAVLARILDPTIFGIVSICTMILNFFHIFANLGFSNSIIYKQETDRKILSTIFFASVSLGFIICFIMILSSGFVAAFYNEPKLSFIIKAASLGFPLICSSQIYWILLQKDLNFKALGIIEMGSVIAGAIFTITLALNDYKELSLIYGQLFSSAIRTVFYVSVGLKIFRPMWYFKLSEIKDHLIFGLYNIGQGILGFIGGNMENIVIGKFIGLKELGYYTIAYQLAVFPISRLNPIILQVTYPIMAKMKDNDGLKRAYLKIVDFITYCNFPLLAGLFITAGSVVPLIYGSGWDQTILLTRLIVFVSVLMCITAPVSSLAFSKGKPNLMFYLNLITFVLKIPLLYIFSKYFGLLGIIYAYLITTTVETVISCFIVHRLVGNFLPEFLTNIYKPLLFCFVMVSTIYLFQQFYHQVNILTTALQVALGGLIYIGLTLKYKISFKEILELKKSI